MVEISTFLLFTTHRKIALDQTRTNYKLITEDERALTIKEQLGLTDVEFVTVSGAYSMWGVEYGKSTSLIHGCPKSTP